MPTWSISNIIIEKITLLADAVKLQFLPVGPFVRVIRVDKVGVPGLLGLFGYEVYKSNWIM